MEQAKYVLFHFDFCRLFGTSGRLFLEKHIMDVRNPVSGPGKQAMTVREPARGNTDTDLDRKENKQQPKRRCYYEKFGKKSLGEVLSKMQELAIATDAPSEKAECKLQSDEDAEEIPDMTDDAEDYVPIGEEEEEAEDPEDHNAVAAGTQPPAGIEQTAEIP